MKKPHENPFEDTAGSNNHAGESEAEEGTPSLRARLDAPQAAHAAHNVFDSDVLFAFLNAIVEELE